MKSGKRILSRLAVAALAVAGFTVGAWAQVAVGAPQTTMGVNFNVKAIQTIEAVPNDVPITEAELRETTTGSVISTPTGVRPGNLGIIKVTTNSESWDVQLSTKWGGRLVREGTPTPGTPTCPGTAPTPDPWDNDRCIETGTGNSVPKIETTNPGVGTPLKYKPIGAAPAAEVLLEIGIGIADSGKKLSPSASLPYYGFGAPSNYLPSVKLGQAEIGATNRYLLNGTDNTASATPISFATWLDDANSSYTSAIVATPNSWAEGTDFDNLGTNKFGLSKHDDMVSYFYVNVGLNKTVADAFAGNQDGDYGETLYFDLVAQF